MRLRKYILFLFMFLPYIINGAELQYKQYNVMWDSQSENSWGSMPAGNGDISTNVWVNKQGEIELYIGKTDAFCEINRLLKIGKLTLRTSPVVLNSNDFIQELDIQSGLINIKARKNNYSIDLNVWVDANAPIIHISGNSSLPINIDISCDMWRTERREIIGKERHAAYGLYSAPYKIYSEPDTWGDTESIMTWYHYNKSSIFRATLENQNIEELVDSLNVVDPLLNNIFGAMVNGYGLAKISKDKLSSNKPLQNIDVRICVNSQENSDPTKWTKETKELLNNSYRKSLKSLLKAHKQWWSNLWHNHYIFITSDKNPQEAFQVTQSYILQRYINVCAGRGKKPIKFNGSIFTVDLQENLGTGGQKGFDADFREWGGPYWWQNTRLPYSTMLYSGDYDMMKPLFDMYMKALPLAKYRTNKYFGHKGAYFPETFCFWGTYAIDNYGWNRDAQLKDGVPENLFIRYYYQSNIEVVSMMMDYYMFSQDREFLHSTLIPFTKEVVWFYSQHYGQDGDGIINISPTQSLETFFEGVVNPLPDIAGLKWILSRLPNIFQDNVDEEFMQTVNNLLGSLPQFPIASEGDKRYIVAGYNLGERKNVEKPELYAVFPYRWYGIGQPDLDCAIETYNRRVVKEHFGWQQDGIFAANLGLDDEAKRIVVSNFSSKHRGSRFPAFWGPNYDWVPDQDHGSVTMRALQNMLIQHDNNTIHLLGAWPKDWNVKFKVHTPCRGVLEGSYNSDQEVSITQKKLPANMQLNIHR